jgi:hypothetical protein
VGSESSRSCTPLGEEGEGRQQGVGRPELGPVVEEEGGLESPPPHLLAGAAGGAQVGHVASNVVIQVIPRGKSRGQPRGPSRGNSSLPLGKSRGSHVVIHVSPRGVSRGQIA